MPLDAAQLDHWRERLRPLGVWCVTDAMPASGAAEVAATIDAHGYSMMWLPETLGRDPFAHIAHLVDRTTSLTFGTGIAGIHHRHPGTMLMGANTLAEQSGGRFVLGLGVSHRPMVEGLRGLSYDRPIATMRTYLEQLDAAPYLAVGPEAPAPRVLAALGPRMLELAAGHADGALTYWGTPEHTATARAVMGPGKLLCVEQKVVLTERSAAARATGVAALSLYADLPNYRNNWLRLGFTEAEIDGREPRFVDAVVAWGDAAAIRERIDAHFAAGADHVCIQPIEPETAFAVDREALRAFSPR